MANVLLGVTGSVAAIKTPDLYGRLQGLGHAVKVVATQAALYFFDPAALDPLDPLGRTQPRRGRPRRGRMAGPRATAGATSAATTCCTSSCAAGPTCC